MLDLERINMAAPREAKYDDQVTASCTAVASSEDIFLQWKVNKESIEGTQQFTPSESDIYVTSNVTFLVNNVDDLSQVNVICFWNESAMENQMQKMIKIIGK